MLDLDLLRRLRLLELTVDEVFAWQSRGSSDFRPRGSTNHHTADSGEGVQRSLGIVTNGRGGPSPLPGPLANVFQPREESRRVCLVAAGRANHAGKGGWHGLSGNSSVWGLEVEHCGYAREPMSELRIDTMARVHAAFLLDLVDPVGTMQHYEWTTRKIDFCRPLLDPDQFRRRVYDHIRRVKSGPNPPKPPTPGEIAMPRFIQAKGHPTVYLADGEGAWANPCASEETVESMAYYVAKGGGVILEPPVGDPTSTLKNGRKVWLVEPDVLEACGGVIR